MDTEAGKIFIGGISWETTEERLREHFSQYGEVTQAVVMRDKATGRPRGFGFVAFADPSLLDRVLQDQHTIDGRTVEAKRALSREEQHTSTRSGNLGAGRTTGGAVAGGNIRTKKIFVGGLPPTLSEDGFRLYFETYGKVTDVAVMYDQSTQRPRGFGFITFDTEEAVDLVLHKNFHEVYGKMVEVKRALPRDANPGSAGGRSAGGATYQSYGGPGTNTNSYDGRMDANRYMQPQATGGGYPAYGSSGYGAPSYGYGAANNVVGYGGYGVGGYGNAPSGYNGPAGTYGNPTAPQPGYVTGPPGALRSPWNNQDPSGYGSGGYSANTVYGAGGTWNAPGNAGGTVTAPSGQSPGGNTGYVNQGYGYGGYGGTDGSYGSQGGYGAVGGRGSGGPNPSGGGSGEQRAGSGYVGGGYSDTNGNSGYLNSWRSDPSQGGVYGASQVNVQPAGPANYGGGYGDAPSRQPQQQQ